MTDAEIALWRAVAHSVVPRKGAHLPEAPVPPPAPTPAPAAKEAPAPFLPPYVPPPQVRRGAQPPLAPLEKRYRAKVARGRIDIDGAIDLHGMTQPQAHAALVRFVRGASAEGARLILVVTGKGRARVAAEGRGEHGEPGVLRRAVPVWLRHEDLRSVVLGFEEAALPHGGLGALYVRLRRRDR